MKISRLSFRCAALSLIGLPYIYGSRNRVPGVDCSGVPIVALYEASLGSIDLRKGWWSDRFWEELEPIEAPLPGDLAFYSGDRDDDVEHVMVVEQPPVGGVMSTGIVFGAVNGKTWVTTPELAKAERASVRPKQGVLYRPGFRGFRSMSKWLTE